MLLEGATSLLPAFVTVQAATERDHDRQSLAIRPIRRLARHPLCLCQPASMFSCVWVCTH